MSDYADNADNTIYSTIAASLAAARRAPSLIPDRRCHFCAEIVATDLFFCNHDCRDDFERQERAWKIQGK